MEQLIGVSSSQKNKINTSIQISLISVIRKIYLSAYLKKYVRIHMVTFNVQHVLHMTSHTEMK